MVKMEQSGRTGLPGEIKMADYPKEPWVSQSSDDTITGIDAKRSKNVARVKASMAKNK
jgi:hypothetical protein